METKTINGIVLYLQVGQSAEILVNGGSLNTTNVIEIISSTEFRTQNTHYIVV